jgi:hypothetical protein
MKLKIAIFALVLALVGVIGLAPHAAVRAQETPTIDPVPVTSSKNNGNKNFNGTWTIDQFVLQGEEIFAEGTLVGEVTNKHGKVTKSVEETVLLPVSVAQATATGRQFIAQQATPGVCEVLNLVLGPITLNLLGLNLFIGSLEDRGPILIEITADAAGGLLGQLLCGLAGGAPLPDLSQLIQLVQLLNELFQLLG